MVLIKEGNLEDCLLVQAQIPEFQANLYGIEVYKKRLENVPALVLIAYHESMPVGFKIGYERGDDGSFYSWMGGVLPTFRSKGIAQQLADYQEYWAKTNGYSSIVFKSRNLFKPMLIFGLKNGFNIEAVESNDQKDEHKIILRKML